MFLFSIFLSLSIILFSFKNSSITHKRILIFNKNLFTVILYDLKNVIILLYYEELGIYENVCKLVKRNKVEYKFLKSDPVVLTYINMLNNDIDDVNEKIIN